MTRAGRLWARVLLRCAAVCMVLRFYKLAFWFAKAFHAKLAERGT